IARAKRSIFRGVLALDASELSYRRLALTGGQDAADAMLRFARAIQDGQERLNSLPLVMTAQDMKRFEQETGGAAGGLDLFGSTAIRTGLAIVGIHSAVSTLSTVVRTVVGDIGSFDAAMREAYTIGIKTTEQQEQLRQQILQLPPALGSSTELAKG